MVRAESYSARPLKTSRFPFEYLNWAGAGKHDMRRRSPGAEMVRRLGTPSPTWRSFLRSHAEAKLTIVGWLWPFGLLYPVDSLCF